MVESSTKTPEIASKTTSKSNVNTKITAIAAKEEETKSAKDYECPVCF